MKWHYKAYDKNFDIYTGFIDGENINDISLKLRGKGLQLVELRSINEDDIKFVGINKKISALRRIRSAVVMKIHDKTRQKSRHFGIICRIFEIIKNIFLK